MEDVASLHGDGSSTSVQTTPVPPSSPEPLSPNATAQTSTPAHTVVRLIQCSRCSFPFRTPLRLPCGNTLCRGCLPLIRPRIGVSYPANESRKLGFTCYWGRDECGGDHCLGDCGTDVLLTRLIEVFDEVLTGDSQTRSGSVCGEDTRYKISWKVPVVPPDGEELKSVDIGPDSLKGVYDLAKRGQFDIAASAISYEPSGTVDYRDSRGRLETLTEAVRNELDCQVCYSLILDPLTTSCGHTFCRSCVAMAVSHSDLCPICRQKLNMSLTVRLERVNKRIAEIIETLLPEEVAARREELVPDALAENESKIPLFITSVAFPTMPIFLHIFEPRYRLMLQRVMRRRNHRFGMVMPNRSGRLQLELGRAPFMQYGTMLAIDRYELLPDGRSLVIATGVSRFKVISSELVDGYHVGKIKRVDDVSISEEEAQESIETSAAIESTFSTRIDSATRPLESLSTQQLFQVGVDFVLKQRRQGAGWLHPRVLLAYGALPTDPAQFPWWFATLLPVWEEEKYALLSTNTVRQRLKITARWVRRLESRDWGTVPLHDHQEPEIEDGYGSYLPQTLVLGLFLAIFATQMAANVVQNIRGRQDRVQGGQPMPTQPERPRAPTETRDDTEGPNPDPASGTTTDEDAG